LITSSLRRRHLRYLSRRSWRRRIVFWVGALAVGVVSVGFAFLADLAQHAFASRFAGLALPVTCAGFVLSAWLCRRYFPGAQGSGIPQAIAALMVREPEQRQKLLSFRLVCGKIGLTVVGLACGASIGREGPTVQIGASLLLLMGRWGRMGRQPSLILAGSAAGVAAAFNTPLAGIVFAIEEMSKTYEANASFLMLTAVILAGLASLGLVGNYDYFGTTSATLGSVLNWPAVILCGLGGGTAGALFTKLALTGSQILRVRVVGQSTPRALAVALLCGLVTALIGVANGGACWGTGYAEARAALEGHPLPWSYGVYKFIATLCSVLSTIPGGLFAPSLAVGAGFGSAAGSLFPAVMPGAMVMLGMAGYFSGVVQAPITAFVIITEMTGDHSMILPLMVSAMLGHMVSRLINPEPLYKTLATRLVEQAEGLPYEARSAT
jgi:H+/Cl- antiporter ClcA